MLDWINNIFANIPGCVVPRHNLHTFQDSVVHMYGQAGINKQRRLARQNWRGYSLPSDEQLVEQEITGKSLTKTKYIIGYFASVLLVSLSFPISAEVIKFT
jgi:hypothetical protein